ncbi:MAG: DUF948 domain-containing protein [Candidatus Kapabacteria bacterium]|nr:DUF948 domain-containing protein [Candidatus Kapabacteria bacterium]
MDNPVLVISATIALLSATALCIVGAVGILRLLRNVDRMTNSIEGMQQDVRDVKRSLQPVLEKSAELLDQTQRTIARVDQDLQKLSAGADTFKAIADDVRVLEHLLISTVRPSVEELASFISGLVGGVTSFAKRLTRSFS